MNLPHWSSNHETLSLNSVTTCVLFKSEISRLNIFTFLSIVMPLDFIRSIIPRRLQHRDGEEIFSSLPADQASGKATSCALQDPPPPYASESHALDDDKKPFDYPSSIQPATAQISTRSDSKPSSCGSIQVCPHATSSFERIQRVVRLPDFKQSYKGLDALTPGPDHRNPFSPGFKVCKPDSGSDLKIGE